MYDVGTGGSGPPPTHTHTLPPPPQLIYAQGYASGHFKVMRNAKRMRKQAAARGGACVMDDWDKSVEPACVAKIYF